MLKISHNLEEMDKNDLEAVLKMGKENSYGRRSWILIESCQSLGVYLSIIRNESDYFVDFNFNSVPTSFSIIFFVNRNDNSSIIKKEESQNKG